MSWYGFKCEELRDSYGSYEGFKVSYSVTKRETDVILRGASIYMINRSHYSNIVTDHKNPYAFYTIFEQIKNQLLLGWEPSKSSMLSTAPPDRQKKWMEAKVQKYWCKAIHNQWLTLMSKMSQEDKDLARALFAANFKRNWHAGNVVLEEKAKLSAEHIREIIKYPSCAMLAEHHPEIFTSKVHIKEDECLQDLDEADTSLSELLDVDDYYKGDMDWRGFFAKGNTISPQLTETLLAVKPGIRWDTLENLKEIEVLRPLKSKPELVVSTALNEDNIYRPQHIKDIQLSPKETIITAMKIAAIHHKTKMSIRKTEDLHNIASAAAHAPIHLSGTIDKLVDNYFNVKQPPVSRVKVWNPFPKVSLQP